MSAPPNKLFPRAHGYGAIVQALLLNMEQGENNSFFADSRARTNMIIAIVKKALCVLALCSGALAQVTNDGSNPNSAVY